MNKINSMLRFGNDKELLNYLKDKKIIIYGTGNVGRRFYLALKKHDMDLNVVCFAVTKLVPDGENIFMDKNVVSVNEIILNSDSIVCVAVHETVKNDIEEELKNRNIINYIWIYPYIFNIYLDDPIYTNKKVPIKYLVERCTDYSLAVRHLAIEDYFGLNSVGAEIYVKAQKMSCNMSTALKRLNNFNKLINDFKKEEVYNFEPILIDSNYKFFDGAHRLSLYVYFKKKEILCNVFSPEPDIVAWLSPEAFMIKEYFTLNKFSEKELELIDDTYKKIRGEQW